MKTIKSLSMMLSAVILFSVCVNAQSTLSTKTTLSKFQIGGFIQPKYAATTDTNKVPDNSFGIRRFEVKISADLTEQLGMELTYDFGSLKSGVGGDLRDAFIKLYYNDWLRFQLGQFKKPMMKEEFLISSSALRMIDRGLIDASLAANLYNDRDMGFMLNGDGYNEDLPFEYWVGIFNGNGRNQSADDNSAKQYVAHLEYSPLVGLVVGGDISTIAYENNYQGSDSPNKLADKNQSADTKQYRSAYGFNAELAYEDLTVLSEYYSWENYNKAVGANNTLKAFNDPLRSVGFYVNPIYLIRYETDFFTKMDIGAKFEYLDLNIRSGRGNDITRALTLGTSFYINENGSRVQFNFIRMQEEAKKAAGIEDTFYEGVLQFTVKF